MRRQRGQSALEFALMSPLILLIVFGAIYGGIMFIEFMNYSNEARTIAREIAVASTKEFDDNGTTTTQRKKLFEQYNGEARDDDGNLIGGIYKIRLTTVPLKNGEATTTDDPDADEVGVKFEFDHGRDFPFGFPPRTFAATYRMQLEDN